MLYQVGFNITPKRETTLNEMLSFNLDRYLDELQEVAARANKEFSIEKVSYLNELRFLGMATFLQAYLTIYEQ